MELRQLEYFLAILKEGGFSAAAEKLFLSQSSLSKQIIKLERELGRPLFTRTPRPVTLTEAGRALAQTAPDMVRAWERLRTELGRDELTLALTPIAVHYGFPQQVSAFTRACPEYKVQISEHENSEIVRLLEEERVELALFRLEEEDAERLSYLPLHSDELALVVPSGHPLARAGEVSLRQLRDDKFILLGGGTRLQGIITAAFERSGFQPEIVFEGSNADTIGSLIVSGAGVSIMLSEVAKHLAAADARLSVLRFSETSALQLVLAGYKGRTLTRGGRALWEYFRAGNSRLQV